MNCKKLINFTFFNDKNNYDLFKKHVYSINEMHGNCIIEKGYSEKLNAYHFLINHSDKFWNKIIYFHLISWIKGFNAGYTHQATKLPPLSYHDSL